MRLVKLDAVGSTNDFLKALAREGNIENFTVVSTENQISGRGQMGSRWEAEPAKNLTFSVLVQNVIRHPDEIFNLNIAIAVSLINSLENCHVPNLAVKWPNDIMSGTKKIGGILIENVMKPDGEIWSVGGIGLNVNQKNFAGLPKASSMAVVCGIEFDRNQLLQDIASVIESNLTAPDFERLRRQYLQMLFRKNQVSAFSDGHQTFNGIIRDVDYSGKLVLETDSETKTFSLKEIELLY